MTLNINAAKPVKFNLGAIEKALKEDGYLIAETKYDSVRFHMVIEPNGKVTFLSRANKPLPALQELFQDTYYTPLFEKLLDALDEKDGLVIDGEVFVKGSSFQSGCGMLRRKAPLPLDQLEFVVYGALPLGLVKTISSFPSSNQDMLSRVRVVTSTLALYVPEMKAVPATCSFIYRIENLFQAYEDVRGNGFEGLVVKRPKQAYHRGKKVGWWKMKPEDNIDGEVVSVMWGTEGKANEGKVIGFNVLLENGVTVAVDGLCDILKNEYTARVNDNPDYFKGWAIQVKYMEMTEGGSLRHPKFDCWRGTELDPNLKS